MTTVKDLINTLQTRNPSAQVFLATQRKAPHENYLAGVVGREEMADQRFRIEPGVRTDDVFLVVGKRIRPGSLSAWILAETRPLQALVADSDAALPPWQATLKHIAQHHLQVATLRERGHAAFDDYTLGVAQLSAALTAAYRAGIAAGIRHTVGPDADLDHDDDARDREAAEPAPGEPQQIGPGAPQEAALPAPEETTGEVAASAPKATEAAFGVIASSPAAVSASAPEVAPIAPGEAPAIAPREFVFAPIAPDPAETAPGGSEND